MKILHTADIHLHGDHPRRLEGLRQILALGRDQNIDLLLIAGDLFDDHVQAELLRGEVRGLFSNLPYTVLAIPGNHDERAFSRESFYGNDFTSLTTRPFAIQDFGPWRIVALPYGDGSFAPLADPLRQAVAPGKKNVLMLHCTWSLPHYTSQDYGGDDQLRYLPVTEETLTGLGYDYILAGHFHSCYRQRRLPCGALFVYPGSPVSISSREEGRRAINLIDDQGCRPLILDTWYFQSLNYRLNLRGGASVLEDLAKEISLHPDDLCNLTVRVDGYIQGSETDFQRGLERILANRTNTVLEPNYRSARQIFSDPLYQRIRQHLEQEENEEDKALMEMMLLDAFSQLLAEGK